MPTNERCRIVQENGAIYLVMPDGTKIPAQTDIDIHQDVDMVGRNHGMAHVTVTVLAEVDNGTHEN